MPETSPALSLDAPTALTRRRYDRVAPFYDAMEWWAELGMRSWRRRLWEPVQGAVLEVGVGTGKNLRFHPPRASITAIDISERMLDRARRRVTRMGTTTQLGLADVQALPFDDDSFDEVVSSFVFCSVPDAVRGLRECHRVLRPGGRLRLLEHVLSTKWGLRRLMRWCDPLAVRLWGAHLDRDTAAAVHAAGFETVEVSPRWLDVVVHIEAFKA